MHLYIDNSLMTYTICVQSSAYLHTMWTQNWDAIRVQILPVKRTQLHVSTNIGWYPCDALALPCVGWSAWSTCGAPCGAMFLFSEWSEIIGGEGGGYYVWRDVIIFWARILGGILISGQHFGEGFNFSSLINFVSYWRSKKLNFKHSIATVNFMNNPYFCHTKFKFK